MHKVLFLVFTLLSLMNEHIMLNKLLHRPLF